MRIRRSRVQVVLPTGRTPPPDDLLMPSGPSPVSQAAPSPIAQRAQGAVAEHRLEVHSQPIIDLATGEVTGIEMLLHIPDGQSRPGLAGTRGLLSDLAGEPGQVDVYGRYLERASQELQGWAGGAAVGHTDRRLFCSVSIDHRFIASPEFLHTVKDTVRRVGLSPNQLLLSIGGVTADSVEPLWPSLQRLKSHGVRVALEGFSARPEVSDLVRRYPFDVVRLDAAFVSDCISPTGEAVPPLTNLVKLAHHNGCQVIGDGAEAPQQREALARAGCDLVLASAAELASNPRRRAG